MSTEEKEVATKKNEVATKMQSNSERFMLAVEKEYNSEVGKVELTGHQRRLIQNYFVKLDRTLKDAEVKRQRSSNGDPLAIEWGSINMPKLAQEVIAFSSVGLDPLQPNHINLMPFKNNANNNYDIVAIIGYRGLEIKAKKYGIDDLKDVRVELKFATDNFELIKKDKNNDVEGYVFDVTNPFDRGELQGGFYSLIFGDETKNRCVVMTLADIEKRKPKYASAEFWGGEKGKYEGGKKVGTEKIEGWYHEMCWKTICRAAYNSITIDSEKIDAHLQTILGIEDLGSPAQNVDEQVTHEIQEQANKTVIDVEIEGGEVVPTKGF